MSAVCILTPLVITSWPTLSAAIVAAASAMGFAVTNTTAESEGQEKSHSKRRTVETEVENSEVIQEGTARGQKIVVQKSDITVEFAQDQRGRCRLCVTGTGYTDAQLRKMGQEVAGRIVQQFTYDKLLRELKSRKYKVVDEQVLADDSVKLRIRL